jgi:hypothetical protein
MAVPTRSSECAARPWLFSGVNARPFARTAAKLDCQAFAPAILDLRHHGDGAETAKTIMLRPSKRVLTPSPSSALMIPLSNGAPHSTRCSIECFASTHLPAGDSAALTHRPHFRPPRPETVALRAMSEDRSPPAFTPTRPNPSSFRSACTARSRVAAQGEPSAGRRSLATGHSGVPQRHHPPVLAPRPRSPHRASKRAAIARKPSAPMPTIPLPLRCPSATSRRGVRSAIEAAVLKRDRLPGRHQVAEVNNCSGTYLLSRTHCFGAASGRIPPPGGTPPRDITPARRLRSPAPDFDCRAQQQRAEILRVTLRKSLSSAALGSLRSPRLGSGDLSLLVARDRSFVANRCRRSARGEPHWLYCSSRGGPQRTHRSAVDPRVDSSP